VEPAELPVAVMEVVAAVAAVGLVEAEEAVAVEQFSPRRL